MPAQGKRRHCAFWNDSLGKIRTNSLDLMSIGLLLVAVGYLRSRFVTRTIPVAGDFAKRVILLASVLLFSLYSSTFPLSANIGTVAELSSAV